MSGPSDASLLEDWSARGSEDAFAILARRYAGLLYHAAMRQTGSGDLAGEATQNALLVLARKASHLGPHPNLAGWLHRTVCYEAAKLARRERRHQARMKRFTSHHGPDDPDSLWQEVAPLLDQALDSISEKDRQVIFLKYFDGMSFEQMASQFGGEAAAWRQRGSRAVEKLRLSLTKRGVAVSSTTLATGLGTTLSQAAPASVIATVSASPAAGAAALSWSSLTIHSLHLMKLHPATWIVATLVLAAIPLGIQAVSLSSTRARVAKLQSSMAHETGASAPRAAAESARTETRDSGLRSLAELIHAGQHGATIERLEAERRIAAMSLEDLEQMLLETVSLELPREKRRQVMNDLFLHYSYRKEPKTPVEKVLRMAALLSDHFGTKGQETVWSWAGVRIKEWAAREPEKALAWYQAEKKSGRLDATRLNLSFPGSIYTALHGKSTEQAEEFYHSMSDDERMSVIVFFNQTSTPEEFVDRAAELQNPAKRQSSLMTLFRYGTKGKSPAEVAAWLERSQADGKDAVELLAIAAEGRPYREKEGSSIRSPMHMTPEEIAGRIEWLGDPSVGENSPEAIGAFLAGTMKSSPAPTQESLDKEWAEHQDQEMLAAYISRAGSSVKGVIDALQRSRYLEDPQVREQALRELMQGSSAEAAREAIRDGGIPPEAMDELKLPPGIIE